MLISILDLVSKEGGVFLGERVVLARSPPHLSNRNSWFASSHKAAPGLGPALLFLKDSHSHSGFNVSAVLLSSGKRSSFRCCCCCCCCSVPQLNTLGVDGYMQLYLDKCEIGRDWEVCVFDRLLFVCFFFLLLFLLYILLLALHLGSHTLSWEDLRVSSFLEGGYCWARCWSWRWLKLYSPQVTVQRKTNFLFNLGILVGVSVLWSNFICSFAACLGDWCSTRIPVSGV